MAQRPDHGPDRRHGELQELQGEDKLGGGSAVREAAGAAVWPCGPRFLSHIRGHGVSRGRGRHGGRAGSLRGRRDQAQARLDGQPVHGNCAPFHGSCGARPLRGLLLAPAPRPDTFCPTLQRASPQEAVARKGLDIYGRRLSVTGVGADIRPVAAIGNHDRIKYRQFSVCTIL